jgi:ribosomal protein L15E
VSSPARVHRGSSKRVHLDLAGARPEAPDHVEGERLRDVRTSAREQARDARVGLSGVDAAVVVAILDAVRDAVAVAVAAPRVGLAGG